jgi:hypothetical protein
VTDLPPATTDDWRLEELFVRYWDNALALHELAELERRLAADPDARFRFRVACVQAVTAPEAPRPTAPARAGGGRWSRRRVLGYLGGGVLAGVAAGLVGREVWDSPPVVARLAAVRGAVRVASRVAPTGMPIRPGAVVSTNGFDSAAQLVFENGSWVELSGESTLVVGDNGRLILNRGHAVADIRPPAGPVAPRVLATLAATVVPAGRAVLSLGQMVHSTEVGVEAGRVTVASAAGGPVEVVRPWEVLTVRPDGGRNKQPFRSAPDEFAWDLSRPLPDDWHIGHREDSADGPVVRPDVYADPYYRFTEMYQVRSDKNWTRGFCRLHPDSVLRVRYRVDEPADGQVCVCVRSARLPGALTGVLEHNRAFEAATPGKWETLEVPAAAMLDCVNRPRFDPPWVGFQVIFNTYSKDIGLTVSDFRVTRPGGPAAGD